MNMQIQIILKWYDRLRFPKRYDETIKELIVNTDITLGEVFTDNAVNNLLLALYQCEALQQEYIRHGIDEQILLDTLSDIVSWTNIWYEMTGELGLMETGWLKRHLSFQLFRLGRLQFCIGKARQNLLYGQIKKDAPVLEVHIPSGEPLDIKDCIESIQMAKSFYAKYFPTENYECFTCHSWLLDPVLKKLLDPGTNIIAFQKLFKVEGMDQSDTILKYIFRWDAVRENIQEYEPRSTLAEKVKDYILSKGTFYEAYGVIQKEDLENL